jgi:hypothetical protein
MTTPAWDCRSDRQRGKGKGQHETVKLNDQSHVHQSCNKRFCYVSHHIDCSVPGAISPPFFDNVNRDNSLPCHNISEQ